METANKIPFKEYIGSRDGADFVLFTDETHTHEDISKAKSILRSERDVLTIRIANIYDLIDEYKSQIFRDPRLKKLKWYQIEQDDKILKKEFKKGTSPEDYVTNIVLPRKRIVYERNLKESGRSIFNI